MMSVKKSVSVNNRYALLYNASINAIIIYIALNNRSSDRIILQPS